MDILCKVRRGVGVCWLRWDAPAVFTLQGLGLRVQDAGFMVLGLDCKVQGTELRLHILCFRVQSPGSRVQGSDQIRPDSRPQTLNPES